MNERETRRGFIRNAGLVAGSLLGSGVASPSGSAEPLQGASSRVTKGARLRALLAEADPNLVPHVNNVFIARLAELEGFSAVRVGGSVVAAAAYGLPELGLLSMREEVEFAGQIAVQTNLPVIADGDDAGPSPIHAYRATQAFEAAGVTAVTYEDAVQVRVGRTDALVTKNQMVDKIKASVDARLDPDFLIFIRNDSLSEGQTMDQALERGVAYAEAGADMLWFSGMSIKDHAKARDVVGKPLLTSARPTMTTAELKAAKISMIFYHIERVGYGAVLQALKEWKTTGKVENAIRMEIADETFNRAVGSDKFLSLSRKYGLAK